VKVELKNVKIHRDMSEETTCFSATLYIDGVKAAMVANRGTGGVHDIHFLMDTSDLHRRFNEWVDEQPPLDLGSHAIPADVDVVIDRLLDQYEITRQHKRWCSKGLTFRLKSDAEGSYRQLKVKYTLKLAEALRQEHGEQLETILNETI